MRARTILPLAVAAVALVADDASGFTFLQITTGDESPLPDARVAAMGRSRGASVIGGFTAAGNPALLARSRRVEASAGGGALRLKETRSVPAYDSFDQFLVESVYVLNDDWSSDGGAGLAARPFGGDGLASRIGLGVAFVPRWDYRYDYTEEVRDPNSFTQPRDRLLAINDIQSDGRLGGWVFGAGLGLLDGLELGASFELVSGDQSVLTRTWFVQQDSTVFGRAQLSSLSGNRWSVGLAAHPHHSVAIGAHWRSEVELSGDYAVTGDPTYLEWTGGVAPGAAAGPLDVRYPQELGLGVTWRPRALTRTTVQVELNWREWSRWSNDLWETGALRDVWDGRLGLEHVFYNGLPVRFGFLYAPTPQDREIATTAFTFGTGFGTGPVRFDLGFEVASRDYRTSDVFDDGDFGGTSRGDSDTDLLKEVTTGVFLSLGWATDRIGG